MDKEFEEFILNCQKSFKNEDLQRILSPLKHHLWKQQCIRFAKLVLSFASICCAVYFIDSLNWYFCAFGRIIMIHILPIWNWTYLANAKCLIPIAKGSTKNEYTSISTLGKQDCYNCERFEKIDVLQKTSYSFVHDKFLIRGLPVIISDAALDYNRNETLAAFIDKVTVKMSAMVQQEACSLETNLMISKFASVGEVFGILSKLIEGSEQTTWFLSFRNCKFEALKASRLIMPKPYFYPRNLQAPASSWLLMSYDYDNYKNDLNLYGMIIVTQLRGSLKVTLKAKAPCWEFCSDLSIKLFDGESLMFLSNLWIFSYEYSAEKNFSLTFITETDFY